MPEMTIKRMDIEFREVQGQAAQVSFETGLSYMVKEERATRGYELLKQAIAHGMKCLCVTRDPPEKLKEKHNLPELQIIWLSNTYSGQGLPAKNLEELSMYLGKFMTSGDITLIFLDCLEFLIINNNFGIVLKFLQNLKDKIVMNNSILLISVNPGAFESQEINHIEKEMDVVI